MLEYAENADKTARRLFVTGLNCMPETAAEQMLMTKQRYGKTGGTVAFHAYQSFRPGEVTPEQCHALGVELAKRVWGDRGLASEDNDRMLAERGIGSGLCPRDVAELAQRLGTEPGFRAGLKRRAGTEARIGIFKNVFLGRPLPAKGFAHRELAVGWAVLSHNLWVVARLARAEQKRQAQRPPATRHPRSRAA